MVLTPSMILDLGSPAPNFSLIDTVSDHAISPASYALNCPMVIAFICNHCPYVIHILEQFIAVGNEYQAKGIKFIAISSNDIESHPMDGPDAMKILATQKGMSFPYCFDETQAVAKAYQAACTPDLYLFDSNHTLVYHGQFDDSRVNATIPVTGKDLITAMDSLLGGNPITQKQTPSIGCNIKWA